MSKEGSKVMTASSTQQDVVFIDATVPDLQDLLDGLAPGERAFVLDPSSDGMQQIAAILAANDLTDLSSISIVGHGSSGAIEVGDTTLDDADLSTYARELAAIGGALAPGGDLQLYACDTAAGGSGRQFIADLSQYAGGATVAAATQDIGQTAGGENWVLDATAGATAAAAPVVPFTDQALDAFQGTLALGTSTEVWFVARTDTGTSQVGFEANGSITLVSTGAPFKQAVGIAIDPAAGHYFVTDQEAGPSQLNEILEGNINGSGTPTAIYTTGHGGHDFIAGIALDPQNDRLYFSVGDATGSADTGIYSIAESGAGGASELINLSSGVQGASDLAIDTADNLLFFTNGGAGATVATVEVANLTTGAIINSALATYSGNQTPDAIAIDLLTHTLYWTTYDFSNNANNAVFSASYSTGSSVSLSNVQTLATASAQFPLQGVAAGDQQYWVSTSGGPGTASSISSGTNPGSGLTHPVTYSGLGEPGFLVYESVPYVLAPSGGQPYSYYGGGSPLQLNDVTVGNYDGLNLAGATVSDLSGYFVAGDMLNFTNQNGISGSYNASTGVLTLSGYASIADYQTALDSITYSFSGGDPTNEGKNPYRDFAYTVTDGVVTSQWDVIGTQAVTEAFVHNTGTACYCRGTLIETGRGQKKVETLNIGDKVRTASGALRAIKWIGQRSYAGRFVRGRKDILPVCIKPSALADNVPERDLWISPNHAMYIDGVLIEAKDLINGVSIVQAAQVEKLEYFHIELNTHDVLIAEGALSESFIDDDSRGMFHNAHEYDTLYAEEHATPAWYCAPRLDAGYQVEAVRSHLAQRAGLLRAADTPQLGVLRGYIDRIRSGSVAGWAQNVDAPEAPVCLDIYADGKRIGRVLANVYRDDLQAAGLGSGRHSFEFSPPAAFGLASATVEVRRALDGTALQHSNSVCQNSGYKTGHRRAARG
jgi:Hint domain/Domain of unknown function (DUF4347)